MERIIDMHTHAQDVQNEPRYRPSLNRIRRFIGHRGPIWLWERLGYNPAVAGKAAGPFAALTAFETMLRLTTASPDRLVSSMALAGVSRAVVLPIEPFSNSHDVLVMPKAYPGLIPFASVDPRTDYAALRLDDLLKSGARGVKFHPILQEMPPENIAWHPLVEVALAHRVPILSHCGSYQYHMKRRPEHDYGNPTRFEPLLKTFPKQTFILAHMGLHERDEAIAVAKSHPNAILEISFQHRSNISKAINELGASRLVFGSDWPNSDIATPLAEAKAAASSIDDLEKILWSNAERILGII